MSAPETDRRQCFYLVDETQSARLEQFRFALRGLSQMAHNPHQDMSEGRLTAVDGPYMASLFDLLDDHLGLVLNGYTEHTHWVGPKPKQPAPAPRTPQ